MAKSKTPALAPPSPPQRTITVELPVIDVPPMPPKPVQFPATGVSMIRTPDGWSVVKIDLLFTPGKQLELLGWEVVGDEGPLPHNHASNNLRVFVARTFIHPDVGHTYGEG